MDKEKGIKQAKIHLSNMRALKAVFSTEDGKKAHEVLNTFCGLYSPLFGGDKDETLVREGRRQVALYLKEVMERDLSEYESYILDIEENTEEEEF